MIDPVSIFLLVCAIIIIAAVVAFVAHTFGYAQGCEKSADQLGYWRTQAMESGSEIQKLQKITKAYAPYKNPEDGRWHCPRTGEYVDESDIITEIR